MTVSARLAYLRQGLYLLLRVFLMCLRSGVFICCRLFRLYISVRIFGRVSAGD